MLYRTVDNVNIPLTEEEEAEIRAEWAANEQREEALKQAIELVEIKKVAIEKLLENLLERTPSIPEVKAYLDKRPPNVPVNGN